MAVAPPPTGLPVEDVVDDVRAALDGAGVAVLQAPPGAGKTTVVPLRLLDEPWLDGLGIVVLEPRRLATRAAATRMAALLGEQVGATVGYRTRDERRVGRDGRIEVVTEGILTRRLQRDPSLPGVGLVVLDEVHERNLQTDIALALTLDARAALRPDLRVLAMSATLEADRLAALLGRGDDRPAPVVTSDGRAHPVDVRWVPPPPRQRVADAAAAAVLRALREQPGDVLVFLAGAGDIRRVEQGLSGNVGADVDVRPLFGGLSLAEQDLALAPSPFGRRRVVLATDIAESSLTVAGVRVVVDAGQVRSPRYDPRTGLTRLQTGAASRAAADQRAGRAGRTEPGVAYRLWSKLEQAGRAAYPDPEIRVVDLAGFALELAVWGARPDDLRFLDPPPTRALTEGVDLLRALGAVDADGRPTPDGRAMAELGLHPRLAHLVHRSGGAWEACALAALLDERDVLRGHPDELPVDVAERVRLLADRDARHPALDRAALVAVRRRTDALARRVGAARPAGPIRECGPLLALAYPDRVAQARGNGRFRMRAGGGAWVAATDSLATEPFLAVAELDAGRGDSRIRLAAALEEDDVVAATGDDIEVTTTLAWDAAVDDLRATETRRLGGLLLGVAARVPQPGPDTVDALLAHVRDTRLAALRWPDAARALQLRAAFASRLEEGWPAIDDAALTATLDEWLAPLLGRATGRTGLEKVDVLATLRGRLGYDHARRLDELAPTKVTAGNGTVLTVDYAGEQPSAAARVQDLFGTTTHPTVGRDRVPVVLHLLSPARRPVQVTADLPGFWAGSYAAVRKDMAGRYPKHPWPTDPATAVVPARRPRRA